MKGKSISDLKMVKSMANQVKITKKMYLSALANLVKELEAKGEKITLADGITPSMAVEYCEHEIELLNKKNTNKTVSKKALEKQEKDTALKKAILESLTVGTKYSCADIREVCEDVSDYAEISASKLSYLLTSMVNDDKTLCREVIKRVPHFYLAVENEVEG